MSAPDSRALIVCASYRTLYPKVYDLALAIQQMEGYYPGTLAYANCNPGNLRSSPFQSSQDAHEGFAIFPSYFDGLAALLWDLVEKCSGRDTVRLPSIATLADLVNVWAPPSENNTLNYQSFVAAALKLPSVTPVKHLVFPPL